MINRLITLIFPALLIACTPLTNEGSRTDEPCSNATIESIERQLTTSDSEGHGPDIGSAEWYSVVERRLGIEGGSSTPNKGTKAWCEYVISRF